MDIATRLSGQSETHIRSPGQRSRVENAAVRIADLDAAMLADIQRYTALVDQARRIIAQIPQPKFREVLTLRYLCGHSWKTISDELDYADEKSVFRVHGFALLAAEKIFQNTT